MANQGSTRQGEAGETLHRSPLRQDALRAKDELERQARSAGETLTAASRFFGENARSAASEAVQEARIYADGQRRTAAESLTDFAEAIRCASDELGRREQTMVARFAQEAAGSLEALAGSVNSRSIDEMVEGLRAFARSHPIVFVAGSVLAGITIGRLARASGTRNHERSHSSAASGLESLNPKPAGKRAHRASAGSVGRKPGPASKQANRS